MWKKRKPPRPACGRGVGVLYIGKTPGHRGRHAAHTPPVSTGTWTRQRWVAVECSHTGGPLVPVAVGAGATSRGAHHAEPCQVRYIPDQADPEEGVGAGGFPRLDRMGATWLSASDMARKRTIEGGEVTEQPHASLLSVPPKQLEGRALRANRLEIEKGKEKKKRTRVYQRA